MKVVFVDTHCHFNNENLYQNLDAIKKRAEDEGVELFIIPGYDINSSKLALEISKKYDNVYAAVGFHPTEIKNYGDEEYRWLEQAARESKVVAIGEIGFDFHWDTTTKEEQIESFIRQVEIAKKVNKPLIIHSRDANQLTFDMIKKYHGDLSGVMHAYQGSTEMAKEYIKIGFYLGIGGTVTFTNAKEIKEVVKSIPLNYLVTETDSPYLTPHPYRGTPNEPKYIPLVVDKIHELTMVSTEDIKKQVLLNTINLFHLEVKD